MIGFYLVALVIFMGIGYAVYLDSRPDGQNAGMRANLESTTARFDAQASPLGAAQIASISADAAATKTDVRDIKADIGEIKSHVKHLEDNMQQLIEEMKINSFTNAQLFLDNPDTPAASAGTTSPPIANDQPNWQEISDEITAAHGLLKNWRLVLGKDYILYDSNGNTNVLTRSKEATHTIENKLTEKRQKVRYGASIETEQPPETFSITKKFDDGTAVFVLSKQKQ
jgi:exopolysaccharide biosynthesis protein